MLYSRLSKDYLSMRHHARRTARSLTTLVVSVAIALVTACSTSEAPTSPSGNNPGGNVPINPAPTTNGALALTVTGLPFGVGADLTVSGPGGFSRALTTSITLAELTPGRYTISSNLVRVPSGAAIGAYAPSATSQFVDVGSGPPTLVTVTYAALPAVVDIAISGLPNGVGALVKLTSPSGDVVVTTSLRMSPAAAGRWLLSASPVSSAGYTYTPTPVAGDGTVAPGDTLRFPVEYAIATGALAVAVTGLPSSAAVVVAITGPGGFSREVTSTTTLTDLTPGSYTVSAPSVVSGGITYTPGMPAQLVMVSASLVAAPAIVAYSAQVGSLLIESAGLPSGSSAVFTVSGTGGMRTVSGNASTGAVTIDSLVPGSYAVSSATVTANGVLYAPSVPGTTATIVARSTSTVRFTYGVTTGALAIVSSGLPAGTNADITITGPAGFTRTTTSSVTYTALSPGRYTVSARDIRGTDGTYAATPVTQSMDIVAGGAIVTATVSYAPRPAVVEVTVTGLATGTAPSVTLTSPSGQDIVLTSTSTRIAPATAGRWRLAAATVNSGGYNYVPTPTSRDETVALGDTLRLSVQYTLTTGAIAVAVTGLPNGAGGVIAVTGPNNYKSNLTSTSTLTGLPPGTYALAASNVTVGGLPYAPTPATQQVVVTATLIASPATIAYAVPGGRIAFNLTGMPAGVTPTFTLAGQNGSSTVSGTAVLTVSAGSYTMTANVVSADGVTYTPTPSSRALTVNINSTAFATFSYASSGGAATGRLAFAVTGLPANANPSFSLVGPNGSTTIIGSATVDPVLTGTYTLNANNLSSGGNTYVPSPTSLPITINAGTTTTATLSYSVGGGGSPNYAIENVYLTQAIQRPDGGVTLVANRDALLRVFVTANGANTVRPDVRVRVYDGATLLQTVTIPAPETSVRTTTSEGTLTSTWNVVVPGGNIRIGTKVQVDLDPAATITEVDRTDNVWPRGGTPQTIPVATVPAFNVRFVPVTVNGLTGNVSEANKESFLTSTRRYMPIRDVVSDVRAPFTSSAPALENNDSNSAWLTVLSELNALRSSDGAPSSMHYYGVVKVTYTSGVAGYGYVPGRAALGWDYLPSGDAVAVHEWGHNFSRPHTPCSVSGDASYPYAGGVIGVWGWNSSANTLIAPTATDIMGYCSNQWISDWTWSKVMQYRQGSGLEASALSAARGTAKDGLLVWGRVVDGRVILEPSFRVRAPASPTPRIASHRVELMDANGTTLLELPINADRVDHESAHDERQFAVVVPWSAPLEQALARVRVRDARSPLEAAELRSASARAVGTPTAQPNVGALPEPNGTLEAISTTRTRVRWNTQDYPMAMVRDASTGAVMGFVRNSGDVVTTNGRQVEIVYSDGVRSLVRR